jgi:hypothetical protein
MDTDKLIFKFIWREKKTQNNQVSIKEQSWRTYTTWLQDLLSSYSNQDSVYWQTNKQMYQWTE